MGLYPETESFPVVGIGASAGGLKAFKELISGIPERSNMAYVFIQHLDPDHESALPELLSNISKIPVHEITNGITLAPDNIYIIPENSIATAQEGTIKLSLSLISDIKTVNRFTVAYYLLCFLFLSIIESLI